MLMLLLTWFTYKYNAKATLHPGELMNYENTPSARSSSTAQSIKSCGQKNKIKLLLRMRISLKLTSMYPTRVVPAKQAVWAGPCSIRLGTEAALLLGWPCSETVTHYQHGKLGGADWRIKPSIEIYKCKYKNQTKHVMKSNESMLLHYPLFLDTSRRPRTCGVIWMLIF